MATRNEILLAPVSPDSRIIEIGPSIAPIAPKSAGWNAVSIDHTGRDGLIAEYAGDPGVDVSRIEPVDFVWTGGPLSAAVPQAQHGSFDTLIASHVIEHVPDPITFLDAAATLLKPEGLMILAIPDKRYCFDYFQPLTTTGQLLEAHFDKRSRHSRRFAFDHFAYAVGDGGLVSWGQRPSQGQTFLYTLETAARKFDTFRDDADYYDLHAWRFVPASFELLLLELARLGETDWRVERITPADDCEFFAWLCCGGKARAAALSDQEFAGQRMTLLQRALFETQSQIDWLLAGNHKPLETHVAAMEAGLSKAIRHSAGLEVELRKVRQHAKSLESALAVAQAERDAVVKSGIWLATKPVRRLAEAVPTRMRGSIRKLLRIRR